jgi:DNA mismatch repair protein MutS2
LYTVVGARRLRKALLELSPEYPAFRDAAGGIEVFPDLEQAITGAISDAGEVMDSASPALRSIRARIRALNNKVRDTLESIIRSPEWGKMLQDPVVSIRNGRFVVPVKAEMRSHVPGMVHDQSASGATVFIEPMAVVELNNDLRQAVSQEEAEVARILLELSEKVAAAADRLDRTLSTLGWVDFVMARGRLSQEMQASRPALNRDGHIALIGARHPLLRGEIVPIDPYLGREFTTMVITGPNTGGKTVTLKTIGLLTLMAHAGLHLHAEPGSEVAVFDQVMADIGDEQSIEQSLSTFSSHLTHIIDILRRLEGQCLVLLDELGAGTDPQEGAALAMAILEHLHRLGARTVATTHYSELKAFAHTQEGMRNASVEFDVQTLRPTFRLAIGVPGSSNAFAVADRLGLPEGILARARSHVGTDGARVEQMITNLKAEHDRARAARADAEALRNRYLVLKDKYEEEYRRLRAEKSEILRQARVQADSLLQDARREVDRIIGELRAARALASQAGQDEVESAAVDARRDMAGLTEVLRELTALEPGGDFSAPESGEHEDDQREVGVGDEVEIVSLGQRGVVLDRAGVDEYLVGVGSMKINVPRASLRAVKVKQAAPRAGVRRGGGVVAIQADRARSVSTELDLRGMRVEEALDVADKYLDDAILAGIPRARLIHGKGTGALREALRDMLASDRRIKAARPGEAGEGGDGVTVVSFPGT